MRARIESSVALRRAAQATVDACMVAIAYAMAYVLRFDPSIPHRYQVLLAESIGFVVVGKVAIFAIFRLYHRLWRFVDAQDFESILKAVVSASIALVAISYAIPSKVALHLPRGVIAIDFLLTLGLVGGVRFLFRAALERPFRGALARRGAREVLIVGAGNGGQLVAAELRRNPELGVPIGFIDDDPRKQGIRLGGVKVEGLTAQLPRVLDGAEPDEVIIAIPSAPGVLRQKVVTACRERGIPVRTLPTVFELLSGGVDLMRQVREVRVEDVLGREPVRVEVDRVGAYMRGAVVLVTGAGGSIGSELCRQIARVGPKQIVLVDNAENSLFEIRRELEFDRHFGRVVSILADVTAAVGLREVFAEHRPAVVFHAAAYKHVPLMEENAVEAVRNNAVATRIVAAAAGEYHAKRFVLVSTDKAVSPATVMGASKALAEWAVEAAQHRFPQTRYATVRFGNVLGSSGSVVQIFRRQIAAGGPVTVPDEQMTRYFMTIPEAVQLIIRAAAIAGGGEVFVLDMGEPVKIVDLARNMIRLSGQEPEADIAIDLLGRRAGDKLHEELFNSAEKPEATGAEKILSASKPSLDPDWVDEAFARVEELVYSDDPVGLAEMVSALATERVGARSLDEHLKSTPAPAREPH